MSINSSYDSLTNNTPIVLGATRISEEAWKNLHHDLAASGISNGVLRQKNITHSVDGYTRGKQLLARAELLRAINNPDSILAGGYGVLTPLGQRLNNKYRYDAEGKSKLPPTLLQAMNDALMHQIQVAAKAGDLTRIQALQGFGDNFFSANLNMKYTFREWSNRMREVTDAPQGFTNSKPDQFTQNPTHQAILREYALRSFVYGATGLGNAKSYDFSLGAGGIWTAEQVHKNMKKVADLLKKIEKKYPGTTENNGEGVQKMRELYAAGKTADDITAMLERTLRSDTYFA